MEKEIFAKGKELLDFYRQLATNDVFAKEVGLPSRVNHPVYTQSDLTKVKQEPDVVILGMNPGSDGCYKDIDWETFKKGNPFWHEHGNWPYWIRLHSLLQNLPKTNGDPLLDESRYILSNVTFFATKKSNQISDRLFQITGPRTIDLFLDARPKLIVFLSGKKVFDRLSIINKQGCIGSIVYVGSISGIPCIGIPHPSARLTSIERELIRSAIGSLLHRGYGQLDINYALQTCDKLLSEPKKQRKQVVSVSKDDVAELSSTIAELLKNEYNNLTDYRYHVRNEKTHDFFFNGMQLTITSVQKGYIALRHNGFNGSRDIRNEEKQPYPHTKEWISYLSENRFVSSNVWLGLRYLSSFGDNINTIQENLKETITRIVKFSSRLK